MSYHKNPVLRTSIIVIAEIVEEVADSCSDDDNDTDSRQEHSNPPLRLASTPSPRRGGMSPCPVTQSGDQDYADDFEDIDSDEVDVRLFKAMYTILNMAPVHRFHT